jgi:hypothetical protein
MRTAIASLAAVTLIAGLTTGAWAQMGMGMGRGPVAQACATEIGRYCGQLSHGGGQVRACLQSHVQEVSPGCKSALDHTGYGRRWQ